MRLEDNSKDAVRTLWKYSCSGVESWQVLGSGKLYAPKSLANILAQELSSNAATLVRREVIT